MFSKNDNVAVIRCCAGVSPCSARPEETDVSSFRCLHAEAKELLEAGVVAREGTLPAVPVKLFLEIEPGGGPEGGAFVVADREEHCLGHVGGDAEHGGGFRFVR